ncbi:hypothetical protein LCGC14_2865880 [marine sediment metagenome]|uniref:Uncharacterized protein n=1 Tax=marine sediment metagenome TaxID=412755 RepID=A0A0F9AVI8_9ZZZZ
MKPHYRKQGKYKDRRIRIIIEFEEEGKIKVLTLPKPEVLLNTLRKKS